MPTGLSPCVHPEYPVASEKILKWIENANRFQESLENTLDSTQERIRQ